MNQNRDFTKFTDKELLGKKVVIYSSSPGDTYRVITEITKVLKSSFWVKGEPTNPYFRKDGSMVQGIAFFVEYCYLVTEDEALEIEKEEAERIEKARLRQKMLNTHSKLTLHQLRLINKIIDNPKSIVFSRTK